MQVKAKQLGHDGFTLRKEGEVFTMPEGSTGSWFEPVEAAAEAEAVEAEEVTEPQEGEAQPKRRGRPPKN